MKVLFIHAFDNSDAEVFERVTSTSEVGCYLFVNLPVWDIILVFIQADVEGLLHMFLLHILWHCLKGPKYPSIQMHKKSG